MVQTLFERLELKFVISAAQRRALVAVLGERLQPDAYGDATGHYPTVDLYFDSPGFELYWERWRGLPSRRKLRLRVYGQGALTAEFPIPDSQLPVEIAKARERDQVDAVGRRGRPHRQEGADDLVVQAAARVGKVRQVGPVPAGELVERKFR